MTPQEFTTYFSTRFWKICGKYMPPTQEELEDLADECYEKLMAKKMK